MKTLYNLVLNFYCELYEHIQDDEIVLEYMSLLSRLFLQNIKENDNKDIESFKILFESLRIYIYYRYGYETKCDCILNL